MHGRTMTSLMLLAAVLAACATPGADPTTEPASLTPTATASPTPEPTGSPTPTPSPSPSPSPGGRVELGYGARLEIGATANVREAPSASARVLGEVRQGSTVGITYDSHDEAGAGPIFGPIVADGYTWYPVALDEPLSTVTTPWLAIEAAGAIVVQPECPEPATNPTVDDIGRLGGQERPVCFGDRELKLTGRMPLSGLGGMVLGTWEPMWLAWPVNDGTPLAGTDLNNPRFAVYFAEGVQAPDLPPGSTEVYHEVRLVGHFDDPASATCLVQAPEATEPEPADQVELYCRTHFVVTEIELVDS
jgi:hypothetical protein